MSIIPKIKEESRSFFIGASGCHDWTHVERVRNLAIKIGRAEGACLFVLEIAAYLHDIGRRDEMESKGKFCHAERGAEIAGEILKRYDIPKEKKENIIHCVATHRFRKGNLPETLEAKIIFDSDKLDSIGAVGVGRTFLFAGHSGSNSLYTGREREIAASGRGSEYAFSEDDSAVLEWEVKLKHIRERMLTDFGRKIADERHDFIDSFFRRFWDEVSGEK